MKYRCQVFVHFLWLVIDLQLLVPPVCRRYLMKNSSLFSASDYEVAPPEYHRKAVWEEGALRGGIRPIRKHQASSRLHGTISNPFEWKDGLDFIFSSPELFLEVPWSRLCLLEQWQLLRYKVFFFLSHRVRNTGETGMFFLPISGTFYQEQLECFCAFHRISFFLSVFTSTTLHVLNYGYLMLTTICAKQSSWNVFGGIH